MRYGMPLLLQAGILMMDNSFDVVEDKADDPTALLTKIVERQEILIQEAKDLLSFSEKNNMFQKDDTSDKKDERRAKLEALYQSVQDFNQKELCNGIGEALDSDDKKKNEVGMCSKIFKTVLGLSFLLSGVNYALFGPAGFKLPKY